jgi:hypothetical protein
MSAAAVASIVITIHQSPAFEMLDEVVSSISEMLGGLLFLASGNSWKA